MILPAHLLQYSFYDIIGVPKSIIKLPEKILRHVTSIFMQILIKFGIKNDRFI